LENAARCQVNPPPVTEVKRWSPEVGPSVPSRATTRVLGWVVENDFDQIDSDGEFCSVSDVDVVVVARLLGRAVWMPSIAVARPPAIAANQRPWRGRGKRNTFVDMGILLRILRLPHPKTCPPLAPLSSDEFRLRYGDASSEKCAERRWKSSDVHGGSSYQSRLASHRRQWLRRAIFVVQWGEGPLESAIPPMN
jgi:hypothetical protein